MNHFEHVDPRIRAWATRNRLLLFERHRDDDVRSFFIVGPDAKVQIWLDLNSGVSVHVSNNEKRERRRHRSFPCDADTVDAALDQALAVAREWCGLAPG